MFLYIDTYVSIYRTCKTPREAIMCNQNNKPFSASLGDFLAVNLVPNNNLANYLEVTPQTINNWLKSNGKPDASQLNEFRKYATQFTVQPLEHYIAIHDTKYKTLNILPQMGITLLKNCNFNEVIKLGREFNNDYNELFAGKDIIEIAELRAALLLLSATALALRESYTDTTENLTIQKRDQLIKSMLSSIDFDLLETPSLIYGIRQIEYKLKFNKLALTHELYNIPGYPKASTKKAAMQLFNEYETLHNLLPECDRVLWEMLRIASQILKDINICNNIWQKILEHPMPIRKAAGGLITKKRIENKLLSSEGVEFFIGKMANLG